MQTGTMPANDPPTSLRIPAEIQARIDEVRDWIWRQPEMAMARRGSRSAEVLYVILRGLEIIESERTTGGNDADNDD